jgi:arginine exporter protein ArgO
MIDYLKIDVDKFFERRIKIWDWALPSALICTVFQLVLMIVVVNFFGFDLNSIHNYLGILIILGPPFTILYIFRLIDFILKKIEHKAWVVQEPIREQEFLDSIKP